MIFINVHHHQGIMKTHTKRKSEKDKHNYDGNDNDNDNDYCYRRDCLRDNGASEKNCIRLTQCSLDMALDIFT